MRFTCACTWTNAHLSLLMHVGDVVGVIWLKVVAHVKDFDSHTEECKCEG